MFIPINAKADIQGSKKGKLTPAQNAQLNAFVLSKKTGILNCLSKCEATSNTYTAMNNVAKVVFQKGYVVICGRLVECEEGTTLDITTPASGSVTGKIILRYSLSQSQENEFVLTTTTEELTQQDLNDNPINGIYEFELYSYSATPTSITLTRSQSYVMSSQEWFDDAEEKITNSINDKTKPLLGYNNTKGTVEQRLINLGFKRGYASVSNGSSSSMSISSQSLTRQGNYVIGKITLMGSSTKYLTNTTLQLPNYFYPSSQVVCYVGAVGYSNGNGGYAGGYRMTIYTSGQISFSSIGTNVVAGNGSAELVFGFEAPPIE